MTTLRCSTCGRPTTDLVQTDDSLELRCADCRGAVPALTAAQLDELLFAPLELPDDVTELEHTCPLLLFYGYTEQQATRTITLVEHPSGRYREGRCDECEVRVRSSCAASTTPAGPPAPEVPRTPPGAAAAS